MKSVFLLILLALSCWAQEIPLQQQQQGPVTTLRSESRLVLLDVVVGDAFGKPVRGLSKNDFTILEDGKPQNIDSFEPPEDHKYALGIESASGNQSGPTGPAGTQPLPSVSPALTILVIDGLNTAFMDLIYAREMVTKFLRTHGPTLAQPTALMRITDKRLELIHDYSEDSATLIDALKMHPMELPFRYGADPGVVGSSDRLLDTLSCLEKIAAANANFAGRKNVIWVGSGFPAINGNTRQENDKIMSKVADDMRSARLAVYTIDPKGLQVITPGVAGYANPGALQMATSDMDAPIGLRFFENIAYETGGRTIYNRNDVDVAVADSVNDGTTYYTLAYYPSNRDWNGKFRKIKVTLAKPQLEARTRAGYFAIADTFENDDATIDYLLAGAIRNPLPYKGLSLSVKFKPLPNRPGMARFEVAVDKHDLDWKSTANGDHVCSVMLVAMSVSRKDRVVKNDIKELQGIVKAANFETQMNRPLVLPFTAELPPNAETMRVVVRDSGNGHIGTADITVGEPGVANAGTNLPTHHSRN
jgi:VWFA-related protein